MKVMHLIVTILLLFGGCSELFAGNKSAGNFWNDTHRDIAGNVIQESTEQAKWMMNKRVTGSQMKKWVPGNSKVRGRAAVRFNSTTKLFKSFNQLHVIRNAGIYALAADGGASFLGHVYEGDYSGGGAVLVNQTAKAGVSSVGAMSGGYTGAVAGTFIGGPPGTIIGGAIGAIGGAIAGSSAYEYLIGNKLKKLTEHSLSAPEIDYVEESRKSLAKFKQRKREEEIADKLLMRLAEKGENIVNFWDTAADQADSEVSLGSTISSLDNILAKTDPVIKKNPEDKSTRREEIKKQKKDLKKKAERKSATGIDPNREYSSKPVIEQNSTIDIVMWTSEYPDNKTEYTVYINSGQASSSSQQTIPATSNHSEGSSSSCQESIWYFEGAGYLQSNTLHMKTNWLGTQNCVHNGLKNKGEPYTCNTAMNFKMLNDVIITLNIDGSMTETSVTRSYPTMNKVWGSNCSWKASTWRNNWDKMNVSAPETNQFTGVWQKR